ncbi:MAG: AMP-binding protein, partial [Alphaproteobacteria bacterium]|nr:AMP-binding protein [Alphaproteobacteria bacterium]
MTKHANLVRLFLARAEKGKERPFLWHKQGGAWVPRSWVQVAEQVSALSQALKRLGLEPGDRVMLVSENRPEFCIADLAIMTAGCITVPTYTTNTEADHTHILNDSGARAVIVSSAKFAKPLLPAIVRTGHAHHVIHIDPLSIGQTGEISYHAWSKLIADEIPDLKAM